MAFHQLVIPVKLESHAHSNNTRVSLFQDLAHHSLNHDRVQRPPVLSFSTFSDILFHTPGVCFTCSVAVAKYLLDQTLHVLQNMGYYLPFLIIFGWSQIGLSAVAPTSSGQIGINVVSVLGPPDEL